MLLMPNPMNDVINHGSYLEKKVTVKDYDLEFIALNLDHLQLLEKVVKELRLKITDNIPGYIKNFKLIFDCFEHQGHNLEDQSEIIKKTADCKVFIKLNRTN